MTLQLTNQNHGFDESNYVLLTDDLSRIPLETVTDSWRVSPRTLRRRLSGDNMSYQTIWIRFDDIDVRGAWLPIGSRVKASPGISVMRRSTAFIAHSAGGPEGTKATQSYCLY